MEQLQFPVSLWKWFSAVSCGKRWSSSHYSMGVSLLMPLEVTSPKGTVIHAGGLRSPFLDSSGMMAIKWQQQNSYFHFPLLQTHKASVSCFQIRCQLLRKTCFLQTDENFGIGIILSVIFLCKILTRQKVHIITRSLNCLRDMCIYFEFCLVFCKVVL